MVRVSPAAEPPVRAHLCSKNLPTTLNWAKLYSFKQSNIISLLLREFCCQREGRRCRLLCLWVQHVLCHINLASFGNFLSLGTPHSLVILLWTLLTAIATNITTSTTEPLAGLHFSKKAKRYRSQVTHLKESLKIKCSVERLHKNLSSETRNYCFSPFMGSLCCQVPPGQFSDPQISSKRCYLFLTPFYLEFNFLLPFFTHPFVCLVLSIP